TDIVRHGPLDPARSASRLGNFSDGLVVRLLDAGAVAGPVFADPGAAVSGQVSRVDRLQPRVVLARSGGRSAALVRWSDILRPALWRPRIPAARCDAPRPGRLDRPRRIGPDVGIENRQRSRSGSGDF